MTHMEVPRTRAIAAILSYHLRILPWIQAALVSLEGATAHIAPDVMSERLHGVPV